MDAVDFIKDVDNNDPTQNCFFIDPPYFEKGSSLYTNFYSKEDHAKIQSEISKLKSKWLLTYDYVEEIKSIYKDHICYEYYLNYSLAKKRVGKELFFCSDNLSMPQELINNVLVTSS